MLPFSFFMGIPHKTLDSQLKPVTFATNFSRTSHITIHERIIRKNIQPIHPLRI